MTVSELSSLSARETRRMQIWDFKSGDAIFDGNFSQAVNSKFANCNVKNFTICGGVFVMNVNFNE